MANIRTLTPDDIARLLGAMELEARRFDDGNVYTVFPADEEFGHDLVFTFDADPDGWLGIQAFADDYDICETDIPMALAICNVFNRNARIPKAYIHNHRFKLEQWYMFDVLTANDFIIDQIRKVMSMSWTFFTEAIKTIR